MEARAEAGAEAGGIARKAGKARRAGVPLTGRGNLIKILVLIP
jgi:hypothetical protein